MWFRRAPRWLELTGFVTGSIAGRSAASEEDIYQNMMKIRC